MKKIISLLVLSVISTVSYCTTWQITNVGTTFSPSTVTIHLGDSVNFTLESIHNAVEVSQATWNADGNTPLPGGFSVPFGGGMLVPAQLPTGTHYYVCSTHASLGMKGIITVQNNAGIAGNQLAPTISVYPNPANNLLTLKSGNDLMGLQYVITDIAGKQLQAGKLSNEVTQVGS